MEFDFLSPVNAEIQAYLLMLSTQNLGSKVVFHTEEEFPDLAKIQIAIVGVLENRGDLAAIGNVNLNPIRKQLYNLYPGNWHTIIADLGDILGGNDLQDTYFALEKVIESLLKKKIIIIIIGGSQDLTYPLYRSFDRLEQMVNLVVIDNKFDLGRHEDEINSNSYLSKIVVDEPNNLFNYSNLGYQTYFNSQEELDLLEKLFFETYRLGELSNNITISEPIFRDADIISLDLTTVKSCDSGNFITFAPNGFNGKEICSLSRYAGLSDKVTTFGIFNHNSSKQEAVLVAEIIWYFIEGIQYRANEYPFGSKEHYIKYIVTSEEEELVFYKSGKTERWWIEIEFISNTDNKIKRNTLFPCSHEDYLAACNQELPERWLKAQRKHLN
jgi:arginase family enzyme